MENIKGVGMTDQKIEEYGFTEKCLDCKNLINFMPIMIYKQCARWIDNKSCKKELKQEEII